jgi:hypothetical protein
MTRKIDLHLHYQRKDHGIRQILPGKTELRPGDKIHMTAVGTGKMVLLREERGDHAVLRCWTFHLDPRVKRREGTGTRLHRACEDATRRLELLFCTADDETIGDNAVTAAMRGRLLKLYPDHVQVGDAYVLLGERQEPLSEDELADTKPPPPPMQETAQSYVVPHYMGGQESAGEVSEVLGPLLHRREDEA